MYICVVSFRFGDLNYRLNWGSQATNPTESPTQADFDEIVSKVRLTSSLNPPLDGANINPKKKFSARLMKDNTRNS